MSIPSSYSQGSIGGGSSPNGDVKFSYLGFTQTKNSDNLITKITYQGTKQRLIQERDKPSADGGTWYIGYWRDDYGRLQSVDINQQSGPFYHATVNFNKPLTLGISFSTGDGVPQETTLDISMTSLPLQKSKNYDYRWNHALIATTSSSTEYNWPELDSLITTIQNPYTGSTLTKNDRWDQKIAYMIYNKGKGGKFAKTLDLQWVDDPTITPDRGLADWTELNSNNKPVPKNLPWTVVFYPRKPGVDHFEFPTYTITQTGKYNSRLSCAWAMKTGGMLAYPTLGDFGIQAYIHPAILTAAVTEPPSGYWLCEGGTVEYDGKNYAATCKFTYSPDPKGWDLELYDFAGDWSTYLSASQRNPKPVVSR